MADLSTLYRAARYHEPLKQQLGPVESVIFEVMQGPANAPLAWGAILAAVGALLFVGIARLSSPRRSRWSASPRAPRWSSTGSGRASPRWCSRGSPTAGTASR